MKISTRNGNPIKGIDKRPNGRFQVRLYINKKNFRGGEIPKQRIKFSPKVA